VGRRYEKERVCKGESLLKGGVSVLLDGGWNESWEKWGEASGGKEA